MSYYSRRVILIIAIVFAVAAIVFAVAFSLKVRKGADWQAGRKLSPREELDRRGAEMIKRLEEVNREIAASSTLKEALQKRGAAMVKDLEKVNKEINASSTLKEELNERGAEMVQRLEEANKQPDR